MQTTMQLLEKALEKKPAQQWHNDLKLNRNVLHAAKAKGRLSPVIAGALAAKLGEDPRHWALVAVLESEKESGAKDYLTKVASQWIEPVKNHHY